MNDEATHAGERDAALCAKTRTVERVFTEIAGSYDRMNDLISLGMHRIAKRMMVEASGIGPGDRVLDLAGGTGDMTVRFCPAAGERGLIILVDRNRAMLDVARRRMARDGGCARAACVAADALRLPFANDAFDCVAISFGVRNFADIPASLRAARRVLRPEGSVVVLDFSRPRNRLLRAAFRWYLSVCVPLVAGIVAGHVESYRYLAASVRAHPDQEVLAGIMESAGFRSCTYRNIMNGILALHSARKP